MPGSRAQPQISDQSLPDKSLLLSGIHWTGGSAQPIPLSAGLRWDTASRTEKPRFPPQFPSLLRGLHLLPDVLF